MSDTHTGGMPKTTTSGVQARQDEDADAVPGSVGTAPPASAAAGPASDEAAAAASHPGADHPRATRSAADRGEHGADRGSDDGLLDSLGKAISAPVEAAAEADEAAQTGTERRPPPRASS